MPSCCLPFKLSPPDGNLMTIHPPRGCLCLICMSSQSRNFFGGVSQGCFSPLLVCQLRIPVWRAQPTTPSVALGAAQFLARSRNMSGGPYGGGSSLATVRAPARRARAMRPPSRNIIARRRAQLCSPPFERRGRTLSVARHPHARACSRPTESPGRGVRSAKSLSSTPSRVRFLDTLTLTLPRLPISSVSTVHRAWAPWWLVLVTGR